MGTLTRYGIREWGGGGLIAAILTAIGAVMLFYQLAVLGIAIIAIAVLPWLAVAFFFRSPRRRLPADPSLLLSPADGTVRDIEVVEFDQSPFNGRALRIGIFLSVLNVHVNRAPGGWKILSKLYRPGKYLDARGADCKRLNEAMTLSGTTTVGGREFPLAVRQISGAIARRIVCPVEPGEELARGAVYGMIKFGSRTELYLPDSPQFSVLVKVGDKVKAGGSALVRVEA